MNLCNVKLKTLNKIISKFFQNQKIQSKQRNPNCRAPLMCIHPHKGSKTIVCIAYDNQNANETNTITAIMLHTHKPAIRVIREKCCFGI